MSSQLLAIALFVAAFAIANLRRVHLGVVMLATACGVGLFLADMSLEAVLDGFPIGIMVLLAGVTFFFALAQANGTIDALIGVALGRVGRERGGSCRSRCSRSPPASRRWARRCPA